MTLYESVNNVLKRLDDYPVGNGEQVWTRSEVELYLEDGYNAFCRQTKCLLDFFYPENIAPVGNYTARWELGYYVSGMIAHGILSYSGGHWERDYAEASDTGPINHTQPWESTYITTTFPAGVHAVPEDNVAVDRATFDLHQMEPEFTRFFEQNDRSYQTVTGDPWRFSMDRDGMSRLRLVPAGAGDATQADVVGSYGLLRHMTSLGSSLLDTQAAYWQLHETSGVRYDSSGDYDLTDNASVSYGVGKIGNAASFDSTNYLSNADGPGIALGFTVSLWVKVTALSAGQFAGVIGKDFNAGGEREWLVAMTEVGDTFAGAFGSDDVAATAYFVPGIPAGDTDWHHLLFWIDDSDNYLYVQQDGGTVVKSAVALNGRKGLTSNPFCIGWNGRETYKFNGLIDDVRVWHRTLTESERESIYEFDDGTPSADVTGTWGALREVPEHFPMGAQYGIPRRLYSDTKNTRVEYFRLGKDWGENGSELPERFLKYIEYFAQAKCLERDGPGQDLKLAEHFMGRFASGVRRMVKRLGKNKEAVVGKIGSTGRMPTAPALARLPWRYGRQIRRGF